MSQLNKKQTSLLNQIKKYSYFLKGTLNDYCAKCARAECICTVKTKKRTFRLTYKDESQKTKVIYVPRNRVTEVKKLIQNYEKFRKIVNDITENNIKIFKNKEG